MQKARRRHEWLRPLVDTRFQGLFHSLVQGAFHLSFTVLVRYRSLRSIQPYRMVPAVSDRVSRAPPYSGYCYLINNFRVRDYHPYCRAFHHISLTLYYDFAVLQPRNCLNNHGLGCFQFARHYYGNHFCFLFLRLLRCFSSARLPPLRILCLQHSGLPHSDILGSIRICQSPKLFAAYHVLLRLSKPRHPPCALSNLLNSLIFFLLSFYYFNQFQYVNELLLP